MQESLYDCEGNINQTLHMCYPEETLKKKIYLKKACDLSLTAAEMLTIQENLQSALCIIKPST